MPTRNQKRFKRKKTNESSLFHKSNGPKRIKHGYFLAESDSCVPGPRSPFKLILKKNSTKDECDKGDVNRIHPPFDRFASNLPKSVVKQCCSNKMPLNQNGLTPKERSYVISNCQSRSKRYAVLKKLAASAIKDSKIFSIYGSCEPVRKALVDRGWVEKIPATKMNLSKIHNGPFTDKNQIHGELERLLLSNLVDKYSPNFIWKTTEEHRDTTIDMNKEYTVIINKLKIDALWTSKQGLCSSIKRNYWFYIEDEAEVNGPRTFISYDSGEIEGFVKDYRITACTSLLKWILSMVANDRPVFVKGGKISLNVMVFALNRCKEYLSRKQNRDIDRPLSTASSRQWNSFLKKYYRIIDKEDFFKQDTENKLPLYFSYAKLLLKEMHKYRTQISCEGCHNIWIIKPAHCSRGRGIRMASKLGVITDLLNKANSKYVVQKYIEEPILIHETKFDIRQYYLVTSTYPLVIWMYRDCYLKFSSQKYNLKDYHEAIHLTNNAVQKRYTNCKGRHSELPQNNMWDLDKYKDYLDKIGKDRVWDKIIYPGMRKSIVSVMLSCQDSLSICKNRFELYGCDFILDNEYKPWLIEINSCPDLNHTTTVTAKICPAVISDIIKVVVDLPNDSNASTGKFECIYRQPMSAPKFGGAIDLVVRGFSLPLDYFYRGNVEISESYDDVDIGRDRDIQAIINKLKQYYESDVMVELEDDLTDMTMITTQESSKTRKTISEDELSAAATNNTSQVKELKIPTAAARSCDSQFLPLPRQNHSRDGISKFPIDVSVDGSKSITGIKSQIQQPKSFFKDPGKNLDKSNGLYKFSRLEDGPFGKGSYAELKHNTGFRHNGYENVNETETKTGTKIKSSVIRATTNIIAFIKEKEIEYSNNFRNSDSR